MDGNSQQSVRASSAVREAETVDLQVIARFPDVAGARPTQAKLQAKGIVCRVVEAQLANSGAGCAELSVPRHEVMRATDILTKTPARVNLVARSATTLEFAPITCPQCGATEAKRAWPILRMLIGAAVLSPLMLMQTEGRMIYMILVTIWVPCCLVSPSWRCRKCGKVWKQAALTAHTPLAQRNPAAEEKPR